MKSILLAVLLDIFLAVAAFAQNNDAPVSTGSDKASMFTQEFCNDSSSKIQKIGPSSEVVAFLGDQ